MERLLGRCYVPSEGIVKYLVAWAWYVIFICHRFDRLMDGFTGGLSNAVPGNPPPTSTTTPAKSIPFWKSGQSRTPASMWSHSIRMGPSSYARQLSSPERASPGWGLDATLSCPPKEPHSAALPAAFPPCNSDSTQSIHYSSYVFNHLLFS